MTLKGILAVGFSVFLAVIVIPRFFIQRDLPRELHGVWKTNETRYEDRQFLLDENAIGFETGFGAVDWYEIIKVDQTAKSNKTLYVIEYKSAEGDVFKRSLTYSPGNGGKIRFENQSNIEWFPVDS